MTNDDQLEVPMQSYLYYLETSATGERVGDGYRNEAAALFAASAIAVDLDIPIDIIKVQDINRVHPCGCHDRHTAWECRESKEED